MLIYSGGAIDLKFSCSLASSSRCFAALVLSMTMMAHFGMAQAGTKVAFTGDQGTNSDARAVLKMIANEGVDLLLIQGDLGYDPKAASQWEANLNETLGENFPVLTGVGNHENFEWALYQRYIKNRIDRVGALSCTDNPGVKAHCQFGNIEIVQVSPGINEVIGVRPEDNYPGYIADKFSGTSNKWRICSWHKNMRAMQTGNKSNSTGWGVYRSCLNAGAMITVAHSHAYARTHLMSNFENQSVAHRNSDMTLEPGKSFMFVSGLGGRSLREQKRGGDWWASIYTASQGATFGALICDFEQSTAQCYFKAIDGSVPDQFTLRLNNAGDPNIIDLNAGGPNTVIQNSTNTKSNSSDDQLDDLPAVFKRTDSDEYRWIDRDANGKLGNVRIDIACTNAMGGVDLAGDWDDLVALAPGIDSIASPCDVHNNNDKNYGARSVSEAGHTGYVFQRTDKNELRWIARSANGQDGSIRIDNTCARKLGGPSASGDWFELNAKAPAFDQIKNPCTSSASNVQSPSRSSGGYLFVRTDKNEKRWVGKTASGDVSSIRIPDNCARKLGVAPVYGNWKQLLQRAPVLDQIASPCS